MCGYPVNSTWIKAIKAGSFAGWPMLNKHNVANYYLETTETPKGHLNQTRENMRLTKPKTKPFEKTDASILRGKKVRDVYTKVYDFCNTVFSDQTGQFPTRSTRGNKYIMVMVAMQQRFSFETSRQISLVYWWVQQPASHQQYGTDCYHKPR